MSTMTEVFCGVDTHADTHTAAVINRLGTVIAIDQFPATDAGYRQLTDWIHDHGSPQLVGVEGTGSYGAGLTRHLLETGCEVREVTRPDRQHRRRHGKSDPADAVAAARAVAAGVATGSPRALTGPVEAARNLRVARTSAVQARTRIINQVHALILTAPNHLREQFRDRPIKQILNSLNGDAPSPTEAATPEGGFIIALHALAAIYHTLCEQITKLTPALDHAVKTAAPPKLFEICGIGTVVAADLIIAAGTNPDRVHSEAAFAALCGVSAVDASSGHNQRHRLNRGGDRQANQALYRAVIVSLRHDQTTRDYMTRRLTEGKTKRETIRCLKRFLARRIYRILTSHTT
ncbi:MAG: IS110 family transposase [Acidimicrobiia bacterium]|nr:IS110 family transposase [Acidimicrobiia bacterium]